MAPLGIRFLCKNFRILDACAPNRSLVLEKMSTKPKIMEHKTKVNFNFQLLLNLKGVILTKLIPGVSEHACSCLIT